MQRRAIDTLAVEWVPIESVFGNPSNPRLNDDAVDHVAASLNRFGWQQPIVARKIDQIVIAGNTRLKAARKLGMTEVPVTWWIGSDIEALSYSIADNRTAEFSEWQNDALSQLLQQLKDEDALDGTGFTSEDLDALLRDLQSEQGIEELDDAEVEPPENPVSRPGDLWILGDHRLLCGDSTKPADVTRLMDGKTARLLATDPPYLVDYDGTNHPAEHHKKAGRKAPEEDDSDLGNKHWDAYIDPEAGVAFYRDFLAAALPHVDPSAPIYQWHASRRQGLVEAAWNEHDILFHQTIVWVKSRGVLTRSHFLWKSEPAFYGWRRGHQPEKDRRPPPSQTNVWEIDQAGENDGIHPTQKPRIIFGWPIEWHTFPGEVVLEPFSGSGTQIIAAEERGRLCFAMEQSPAFVDAAVLRWERATGKTAHLEDGRNYEELQAERVA